MPRSRRAGIVLMLTPCGRQPKMHSPPRATTLSTSNASQRKSIRPRRLGCRCATNGVPSFASCRVVTATISACGWRSRILINSTAVYPEPPRMAILVMALARNKDSGVRDQESEIIVLGKRLRTLQRDDEQRELQV